VPKRKSFSREMRSLAETAPLIKLAALVIVIAGGLWILQSVGVGPFSAATGGAPATGPATGTATVSAGERCPSGTGTTTIQLAVKNGRNTSPEYLGQTWMVFGASGYLTQLTTNAGSSVSYATVSVDCGATYKLYPVTDDDANSIIRGLQTDKGLVSEIRDTDGNLIARVGEDGKYVEVSARTANVYVTPVVDKHADSIKVVMYDEKKAGWVYASGASTPSAEQTVSDGSTVYYYTTSSNSTAESVSAGTTLKYRIDIDAGSLAKNANDRGIVLAIDVGDQKTYWDEDAMVVKLNGNALSRASASDLTPEESDRFSNYEWFYIIPADTIISNADVSIYIEMTAKSDRDPSTNITTTLAVRGQYKANSGGMKVGAAKDDSSNSKVVSEWSIARVIN